MKHVLFIAPIFHGYEIQIIEELKKLNFNVDYYPELINNWKYKVSNLISKNTALKLQRKYYKKIEKSINGKHYDVLFVIRGFRMPTVFLESFRRNNPEAKMIMYQWDANREEGFEYLLPFFDKVYSFDPYDCQNLGMSYNPLFYTNDIKKGIEHKIYDIFMVGAYMPQRYEAVMKIKEKYKNKYNLFIYFHIPKTTLFREKIRGQILDMSVCHTSQLPRNEYVDILSSSKAILDVSKSTQTGLAIRIIEALASQVKVITTNDEIINDILYDANNIKIINQDMPEIENDFLRTPFNGTAKVNSIKKWLEVMVKNG